MKKFIRKNRILIIIIFIVIIVGIVMCIASNKYKQYFIDLYNNNDFHYNLITFNSVIAGFLFSGISILISLIANPSIKRLWDNGYLDGLYHSGEIGILMSVISIVMSFMTVLKLFNINSCAEFVRKWTIFEITFSIGSLSLFLYCVFELMRSIRILRKK